MVNILLTEGFLGSITTKSIEELKLSKNIRTQIDWTGVRRLAASIKTFGILQPILIDKSNEIVLGVRRFYAAKLIGFTEVPVIVTNEDNTSIEQQLVSDLNSKHLTILERAIAFHDLMDKKEMTKYQLAKYLGFSHNLVCRTLAILKANPRTIGLIKDEKISQKTVATVLYRLKNKNLENYVIDKILKEKLNIIQAGNLVAELNNPDIMKKHFISQLKGFRTSTQKFQEKVKQINLSEKERAEIKKEFKELMHTFNNI